jgi:DNA polymerase-3 subunit alpha
LLFERFLNPGRKGLPDIDIDIQSDRRDEAIDYIVKKYGKAHVAQIIAHGTFQAKKVVIDVARVFDVPHKDTEPVRKSIDIGQEDDETTLEQLRPINEKLQEFADNYPEVYEQALRLEGMVATASKHAAGVVITDKPITDYMPLERGKKGDQVTSWSDRADFPAVSEYGFVKLDALGVKGLSKQDIAVQLIKERHGVDLDLEDLQIVRDPHAVEPEVMDIFTKGLTLGVWQFGSRGITNLVKSIKPHWIGDLIAANALYRPGAMGSGSTWEYAERKEMDEEEIDYWDDSVKPVTAETFGIIAYQEQVMNICKVIGGFSPGQADDMRKAMGKLYRLPGSAAKEFMQGFKDTWDAGVKKIGLDVEVGERIWNMILSFGGYGFNKSHSACYAVQAYQDAYLKAFYPAEFYVGLLTFPPSSTKKKAEDKVKFLQSVIREADAVGVDIGPPDINKSGKHFTLDGETLHFGLLDIKDVGGKAVEEILEVRPFWNWSDFERRTVKKTCNAKIKRGLVESGACDRWGMRDEMSASAMARLEKERLGLSLTTSGDTAKYKETIEEHVWNMEEFDEASDEEEVVVGGDVIDVNLMKTKKGRNPGQDMAKVMLACGSNQWSVTFFPQVWSATKHLVQAGSIMVAGKKNVYRNDPGVVANQVISVDGWINGLSKEEELVEA